MKIVRRRSGVGYYDSHLWLPKTHVSEHQLKQTLTYDLGRNTPPLEAWGAEPEHWRVPRNYMTPRILPMVPYTVFDTRLRSFPYISIKSKVVLDKKDPSKSYQREGSAALLSTYDGILCLRCGAGKTLTGFHTATLLHTPILVVVNNSSLANQWKEEILSFSDLKKDDIGYIGEGKFVWQKKVTIALIQTLARRNMDERLPPEMASHYGVGLLDECHTVAAPFFNAGVPFLHGRRWGLSATPRRGDIFDSLLGYTIGEVVYSYLEPELKPEVYFKILPTALDVRDKEVKKRVTDRTGELHLKRIYAWIAKDKDRTQRIVNDIRQAMEVGRQIIVLTQSIAMLSAIGAHFPEAGLCHGGVKGEELLRRIRECNPVIAIDHFGKQALNKPNLDTLFLCEPFSRVNVLQQIMGRILRPSPDKKTPIFIIYDDVQIEQMHLICNKIKGLLNRWPSEMGGRIRFTVVSK